MSLINDALRRATTKKATPNDIPLMEPIQKPQSQTGGPGLTVILICFVVAGGVCLGGWSYWNKKYKIPALERKKAATAATAAGKTNGAPAAAAGTNVAAIGNSKTNNNPIARAANTLKKVDAQNREGEKNADAMQTPAAKTTPPAVTQAQPAPVTAAPVGQPLPKLQAIFYRLKDSTAMIDGKTVRAGEEVNGAKIIEIKRSAVVIQNAAGVHELTIK